MSETLLKAEAELDEAITSINRCVEDVKGFEDASGTLAALASQNQTMLEGLRETAEHIKEGARLLNSEGVTELKRKIKILQISVIGAGVINVALLCVLLFRSF